MHQGSDAIVLNAAVNGDDTNRALARLDGVLEWVRRTNSSSGASHSYVLIGLSLANQGFDAVGFRDIPSQDRQFSIFWTFSDSRWAPRPTKLVRIGETLLGA